MTSRRRRAAAVSAAVALVVTASPVDASAARSTPAAYSPSSARTAAPVASERARPKAFGAADYLFQGQWLYSTRAAEVPDQIAVDRSGRVFVTDAIAGPYDDGSRMRVYSSTGRLLAQWVFPGELTTGMQADAAGNVHIADVNGFGDGTPSGSIRVYSPTGALVRAYGLPADTARPDGLALAADGTAYVGDSEHDLVRRYAPNGTYLGAIGGPGTAPGKFDGPANLAVTPQGNLVVAESGNHRIQVLSPAGTPLRVWGQEGTGPGQFTSGPGRVAVRSDGHLYVGDAGRVLVFRPTGAFVGAIATRTASGSLISPVTGLSFGTGGALYTAGELGVPGSGVARYLPASVSLKVVSKKAKVKKRKRIRVKLACTGTAPCSGKAVLKSAKKGKKAKKLAKGRFAIAAGGKRKFTLKLTKAGKKRVLRHRKSKAFLTLRPARGDVVTAKIRLRR